MILFFLLFYDFDGLFSQTHDFQRHLFLFRHYIYFFVSNLKGTVSLFICIAS